MPFEMSPDEFRASGHQVVDWIADYLRDIRDLPVLPNVQPGGLIDALPAAGPEKGESMDAIFADFQNLIVPGITHWNHPRFFAYFSISASGPGILGEMLAAALNVNHMLWKTSPAATELEQVTLGWLRQWLGLPDHFSGLSTTLLPPAACMRSWPHASSLHLKCALPANVLRWSSMHPNTPILPSTAARWQPASASRTSATFLPTSNSACAQMHWLQ
jgi:hypothetical protein